MAHGTGTELQIGGLVRRIIVVLREAGVIFSQKNALSRSAAISFYIVTSLAPVILVSIALAGAVFGADAARGLIFARFERLLGAEGAEFLEQVIASASRESAGTLAGIVGIAILIIGSSGVFVELRAALNDAWGTEPESWLSKIVRGRLASLGLVLALGFVLVVSLAIDAALVGFAEKLDAMLPHGVEIFMGINIFVSLALMTIIFAAIYKVLPARPLTWRDVAFGAIVTALLMECGKIVVALYFGTKADSSSVGVAGAMLALLVWVYYSAVIVLFGAALTRARYVLVNTDT
jgi:membrane protein